MVANILAGPLRELAPIISTHCHVKAFRSFRCVLSTQADSVAQAYQEQFTLDPG